MKAKKYRIFLARGIMRKFNEKKLTREYCNFQSAFLFYSFVASTYSIIRLESIIFPTSSIVSIPL